MNETSFSLDFFDLNHKIGIKKIKINRSSKDGISDRIQAFRIINRDSILILSEDFIYYINYDGKVISKEIINKFSGKRTFFNDNMFYAYDPKNLIAPMGDQKVYISNVSFRLSPCDFNAYKIPVIAEFDMKTKEPRIVGGNFPFQYYDSLYGFFIKP